MNQRLAETLGILQEECAEVIVEVSKIRRFGLDTANYNSGMTNTHRDQLAHELGDVLAMIDILLDQDIVSQTTLDLYKQQKKDKLKQWSKIYE
jgi:NTP pyrophosphatase (non-canonical NTP hydrolase)